jgi:electron transfer flavoprotein alpha subunit
MNNTDTHANVMVITEQREGVMQNVSRELLGKARELADARGSRVLAVITGCGVEELSRDALEHGADKVIIVDHDVLSHYTSGPYTKAVAAAIRSENPEIVLFGATAIGRDLAPRVAARIYTGLTADCTSLSIDGESGDQLMTRPAFGGNIMATIICPEHRPQMATVRPGVMVRPERDEDREGEVVILDARLTSDDLNVEVLEVVKEEGKRINIEDAGVLVSVGRGLGDPGKLARMENLAGCLSGEVSGSRAVIDAGWLEKDRQVGQTGKTVRPGVYFALGISGQIQHLAGMEEAEYIIAVNKNPEAPIFEVADLGIVGDVDKVVPALIEELKGVPAAVTAG